MIVMKFGGSSVGSAERIKSVAEIVSLFKERNPVVVVSAVEGITDKLIESANAALSKGVVSIEKIKEKHKAILDELSLDESSVDKELKELEEALDVIAKVKDDSNKIMDIICSFGERMSSRIVAAYFNSIGIKAKNLDAYDIGMITNSNFSSAEPLPSAEGKIRESLSNINYIPVITGFIGKDEKGNITTLGRGGSDYTAAIIGAAISAEEIQIWTDVDGMMTSDPKIVKEAKTIPKISFNEAAELATFGAKVLHPKTILPAVKKNIPVKVLNSFNPSHQGTTILKECKNSKEIVKAISFKKSITLFNIRSSRMLFAYGFLARVFHTFEKYKISVDMVATSEVSVSMTIDNNIGNGIIEKVKNDLSEIGDITVKNNKSIVCLVGEGIKNSPKVIAKAFATTAKNGINIEMVSQGASEINIGFIVDDKSAEKAVESLHKEFFG